MRARALAIAAIIGLAGCATSGNTPTSDFYAMDQDNDACLDRTEFAVTAIYDGWDADMDGEVQAEEARKAWYSADLLGEWDINADDHLDAGELGKAIGSSQELDAWDFNNDGVLSADELHAGLFAAWDADESDYLTVDEAREGLYTLWDRDDNGCLNRTEYVVAFNHLTV